MGSAGKQIVLVFYKKCYTFIIKNWTKIENIM